MRILLFGANGQVGWELRRALLCLGEVVAVGRERQGPLWGDFGEPEKLAHTVRLVQPDVIVNAAAYTAVDQAEDEPELAALVNSASPAAIAHSAKAIDALLVHFSTDYVFNGEGNSPWRESDLACPLNVYGRTKLDGETRIRDSRCRHLIFRTSWVYSARGNNFLKSILDRAEKQEKLQVINDQFGAPTGAALIAQVTTQTLASVHNGTGPGVSGIFHLSAGGDTSWYAYACFVLRKARRAGHPAPISSDNIQPVPSGTGQGKARRPMNCRLDCTALRNTFGLQLPHWQVGVERVIEDLCNQPEFPG